MNTVATINHQGGELVLYAQTAQQVKAHRTVVRDILEHVMIEDVHYGKIPGTPKPTLFKPGAEALGATFRIAPSYQWDDLSDHECVRYRVRCIGTHQITSMVLGEGIGEASSNEEKYKWRKPVCQEEFDEQVEDRRRVKYGKTQNGGFYRQPQIRTEPADLANTVLKMAAKRAQIAMIINVTACSDMFASDLEDMNPDHIGDGDAPRGGARGGNAPRGKPNSNRPQSKSNPPQQRTQGAATTGNGTPAQQQTTQGEGEKPEQKNEGPVEGTGGTAYVGPKMSADNVSVIRQKLLDYGMPASAVLKQFNVQSLEQLFAASINDVVKFIVEANEAGARG